MLQKERPKRRKLLQTQTRPTQPKAKSKVVTTVHLDKPKLVPLILELLRREGKAKFDFGIFRVVERKNGVIRLLTTGKTKKVGAYKAIFFRASDTLRRELQTTRKKKI